MKATQKNLAKFGLRKEYVSRCTTYSPKEYRLYQNNVCIGTYNEYNIQEIFDAEAKGENLIENLKSFAKTIGNAHLVWREEQNLKKSI